MTPFSSNPGSLPALSDTSDGELLRQFAAGDQGAAFTELVRRHSNLVFSTALRRCGSPELAQESAQNVFTALAGKAPRLANLVSLTPWLHRAAVLESAALIRRETRYRQAMKRRQEDPSIAASDPSSPTSGEAWDVLRPLVDDALNALSSSDREVILLHHGEGRSFREIATQLGLTAEAAQRRGHRALEKLAARLRRRGVAVPALTLGSALTIGLKADAGAASAVLPSLIAHGQTVSLAVGTSPAFPLHAWIASPAMLVATGLITAALPVWWQARAISSQSAQNTAGPSDLISKTGAPSAPPAGAGSSAGRTMASRIDFLRQALANLKQTPPEAGPTKLGLQLRKYMLDLPNEELRPVGKLLKGSSPPHREMLGVREAFSTRLAELEPALALELVKARAGKHHDSDLTNSYEPLALLDVLTRHYLPEFLKAARTDPGLGSGALGIWSGHDPLAAIAYVTESFPAEARQDGYRRCLQSWLEWNPSDALQWLDRHITARSDQSGQGMAALLFPADVTLSNVVRRMSSGQAAALVPLLGDTELRNVILLNLYYTTADNQPEIMAELAPFLRLEDHAKPLSVADVVWSWRKKDEAGLSAWVEGLPPGELKAAAERCLRTPNPFAK